jgi:ABC-type lipoprotein export system ATPase subunit
MFRLLNVTYGYRNGARRARDRAAPPPKVLEKLTLTIFAGETTAIIGRSGVGKSTLLYLLGLLWEGILEEGKIHYQSERSGDHDLQGLSAQERAAIRRIEFGFLMQSAFLLPNFRCLENVAMPLIVQGVAWSEARGRAESLMQAADQVFLRELDFDGKDAAVSGGAREARRPLFDLRDRRSYEVSGGERKRLALLRAILHDPDVVFADEPLGNLDAATRRAVVELLDLWRRGAFAAPGTQEQAGQEPPPRRRTLLVVTHVLEPLAPLLPRVVRFADTGAVSTDSS